MRRNNYKHNLSFFRMDKKKGQVAIFVIIALVIIAVIVVLMLYPGPGPTPGGEGVFSPNSYLTQCIEPEIKPVVEMLASKGGYANPEGALEYEGEKIKYLCYTAEYYKTCVVQQPMIKEHFEKELNEIIEPKAKECADGLKKEYERQGYSVSMPSVMTNVSIEPKDIIVEFNAPMTISKDTTQTFDKIKVALKSEIYDLLMLTESIVDYESTYGDSETTAYISYYPDLSMKKIKLSDGSKVYTLRNVVTNESFRFASRSLSWPPGGF